MAAKFKIFAYGVPFSQIGAFHDVISQVFSILLYLIFPTFQVPALLEAIEKTQKQTVHPVTSTLSVRRVLLLVRHVILGLFQTQRKQAVVSF